MGHFYKDVPSGALNYFNLSNHVGTDDVTSILKAFTLVPLYSPRAVSFITKKLAANEVSRKTS